MALDREIARLALPALATLITEPLMLLADAAIIGHLGTTPLAGLGVASNVLGVLVGLSIFLAYATTGTVARRVGGGDLRSALAGGVDGLALAAVLGVVLAGGLQLALPVVVGWYDTAPATAAAARAYLRVAACGLPSILVLLAATGVCRGLQDTRTPLYVAVAANLANIGLNVALVYGAGLGIVGAAWGTVVAQTAGAAVLAAVVLRAARRAQVPIRFHPAGLLATARQGGWLVARTAALWVGLTVTTVVAAGAGTVALATHQVTTSIWALLIFALDAVAIAAQAIVGRALGAGEVDRVRAAARRMVGWGVVAGVLLGGLTAVGRPLYDGLFTPDLAVQSLLGRVLLVVAAIAPAAGIVFVLDGVLIGAGDGRYLALASLLALLAYLPLAAAVERTGAGLVWLWVAYGGYVVARLVTLLVRVRGTAWQRPGVHS